MGECLRKAGPLHPRCSRRAPELETLKSRAGSPRAGEPGGWFHIFQGLLINSDEAGFSLSRMRIPHVIDGSTEGPFPGSFRRGDKNTALESCLDSSH